MAGELIDQYRVPDWFRETSVGYDAARSTVIVPPAAANPETAGGNMRGLTLNKFLQTTALGYTDPVQDYYQAVSLIPTNLTMATGLTFRFNLVDDGTSPADLGLAVVLGVTIFDLSSASFNVNLSAGNGVEQTATVTLAATAGMPVAGLIAVPLAQLGGAVVGSTILVRLRRLGGNTADTCPGRAVLLNANLNNT